MLQDLMSDGAVFWLFVAVAVLAGMVKGIVAVREAHKTLRLAIERNQPLEPAVVDRILAGSRGPDPRLRATVFIALGLALPIAGYVFGLDGILQAFYPAAAVGIVFLFLGIAQWAFWTTNRMSPSRHEPFDS